MTAKRRTTPRRRLRVAATSPLVAGVVAAVLAGGGTTYALWSSEGSFLGGVFTAGDLRLTALDTTWQQVTPGVSATEQPLTGTPQDFLSMPGDVIAIKQKVETYLKGDNLNGGLSVDFADAGQAAQDVTDGKIATAFHIEDENGIQVAPATGDANFGEVVVVPDLLGTDAGATSQWKVVITVRVLSDYQWVIPATGPGEYPGDWAAGNIVVRLEQVRSGQGYTTDGAAP